MSTFDYELAACLEEILGTRPPEPVGDVLLTWRQWLAERNLGLVPIANAPGFAWPGRWVARVRVSDEDHAVVMFGSPSGPLFDPGEAIARGGAIAEGWVVAPLDTALPTRAPYGGELTTGVVEGIVVAPDAEAPLARVDRVRALAGRGLEGDRYAAGRGTFSGRGRGYELTLVESQALADVELSWEEARRNIVTSGIGLNALVGRRFTIGDVECIGRRLAEPCAHLERLTRPGLLRPLVHRAGLRADIVVGGTIEVGDRIAALD